MDYCFVNNENIITNIAVFDNKETAKSFDVLPSYDGAKIGDVYNPNEEKTEQQGEIKINYKLMINEEVSEFLSNALEDGVNNI